MTQQYLIGQLSVSLADLRPSGGDRTAAAVRDLRQKVESAAVQTLPALAHEAIRLTDTLCWAALDRGDLADFARDARTAGELGEFTDAAGLLIE